jgi:transforming growth factor-beta-induced protein
MKNSESSKGNTRSWTAALVLALTAASQVQADPSATGPVPQTVTPAPAGATTISVQPDDAHRGVPSSAVAERLGDFVEGAGSIAFFGSLLRAASLGDLLDVGRSYTVFFPFDGAFSRMTGEQISDLIHDPESLRALVAAHIVPGRVLMTDLMRGRAVFSISGDRIESSPAARPQLNGATLIKTELVGPIVVHVIDDLLRTPTPSDA